MKYSLAAILMVAACSAACNPSTPSTADNKPFSVVEATIPEMQQAMQEGRTSSRHMVEQYLQRIALYKEFSDKLITRGHAFRCYCTKQELDVQGAPVLARRQGESAGSGQFLLFSSEQELALEKLRALDINQMTPVAALCLLAALQERLKGK